MIERSILKYKLSFINENNDANFQKYRKIRVVGSIDSDTLIFVLTLEKKTEIISYNDANNERKLIFSFDSIINVINAELSYDLSYIYISYINKDKTKCYHFWTNIKQKKQSNTYLKYDFYEAYFIRSFYEQKNRQNILTYISKDSIIVEDIDLEKNKRVLFSGSNTEIISWNYDKDKQILSWIYKKQEYYHFCAFNFVKREYIWENHVVSIIDYDDICIRPNDTMRTEKVIYCGVINSLFYIVYQKRSERSIYIAFYPEKNIYILPFLDTLPTNGIFNVSVIYGVLFVYLPNYVTYVFNVNDKNRSYFLFSDIKGENESFCSVDKSPLNDAIVDVENSHVYRIFIDFDDLIGIPSSFLSNNLIFLLSYIVFNAKKASLLLFNSFVKVLFSAGFHFLEKGISNYFSFFDYDSGILMSIRYNINLWNTRRKLRTISKKYKLNSDIINKLTISSKEYPSSSMFSKETIFFHILENTLENRKTYNDIASQIVDIFLLQESYINYIERCINYFIYNQKDDFLFQFIVLIYFKAEILFNHFPSVRVLDDHFLNLKNEIINDNANDILEFYDISSDPEERECSYWKERSYSQTRFRSTSSVSLRGESMSSYGSLYSYGSQTTK